MTDWERFARVLPQTARVAASGRLEVGGCDAGELAREYGTPLYVLCEATFRDRLRRYRECFGGDRVHYAAKAFITRSVVPLLSSEGVGLDCASGGELYTALAGGFPPERVVLHGNNKSAAEVGMAAQAGVGRVVVDSPGELALWEEAGREVAALLRVTPGIEAHTHRYLQTGLEDTKFGVPIGQPALEAARAVAASRSLRLVGLHAHIGSQVLDLEPFAEAARVMTRFLAQVRQATGLQLPELDLGGGLGIAYLPEDDPPAVEDLAKVLREAVAEEAERAGTPPPTIRVEPGRSVAGPAGITLYTVGVIKSVPGLRTYVAVDGGMSDNIRPMLYGARYTFLSASRPAASHDRPFAVAGKLCENGDVLATEALLPADLAPGELVAAAATGAYGYAMASNYNRQPRPAVVAVGGGKARLLARRETYEDLVRLEG